MTGSAFDEYVSARSPMLLRFAYLLCGDRHLAEDLVQEVLIRAHRKWPAVEAGNPDAYLKQALVRAHISWRRRRSSSEVATATFGEVAGRAGFDDEHASREEVWSLLALLPPAQRAVLVLRYFEDLDDRRIAELVGSSMSTVRVNAHRGLARLRETLTERAGEAPAGAGLLEDVRRAVASANRRRRLAAGAGLVVVVVAVALLIPLLRPRSGEPPVQPTPSVTPSVTPSPLPSSDLSLVPLTLVPPAFPYTFSDVPDGLGPAYAGLQGGEPTLVYGASVPVSWVPLSVVVRSEPMSVDVDGRVESTVAVNGEPATQWVGPGVNPESTFVALQWQRDGRWLFASSDGTVDGEGLRRLAESMAPGRTVSAATGPIDEVATVQVVPGAVVTYWNKEGVCVEGNGARAAYCISIGTVDPVQAPHGEEFTVDGNRAYVYQPYQGNEWLIVSRPDGRFITVTPGNPRSFTRGDLIAYYRGVTFQQ